MIVTKGNLVNGTYSLMRISGLTVEPTPEDTELALQVADDYANQLIGDGLLLPWNQPVSYGGSLPSDNSGLTAQMAGPFKKLLFIELCSHFGKDVPSSVAITAMEGMRTLENILIQIPVANNPTTLPIGSGNEYDYRSDKFYPEPAVNNDADYVFIDNILNFSYDFGEWLVDQTLVAVTYEVDSSAIEIQNETISADGRVATAQLTFKQIGGYTLCITATKTGSTDKLTVRKNFIIRQCGNNGLSFFN